jgi:hypothetical protein
VDVQRLKIWLDVGADDVWRPNLEVFRSAVEHRALEALEVRWQVFPASTSPSTGSSTSWTTSASIPRRCGATSPGQALHVCLSCPRPQRRTSSPHTLQPRQPNGCCVDHLDAALEAALSAPFSACSTVAWLVTLV